MKIISVHTGIHYTCAIRCGDRFVEKIYLGLLIIQQTEKCLLSDPPFSAPTETYILFARQATSLSTNEGDYC